MQSKSSEEVDAGPRPRVGRTTVRHYRRLVVLKAAGGAASALGAGIVGMLFWWLKRLE